MVLLHSQIWVCEIFIYVKNVHNVPTHIGIRKHSKHLTTLISGSRTKLFIIFLSLRFFDMRRKRHNFFLCWLFHQTPPRAAPAANYWSSLGELRKSTCFLYRRISTHSSFYQIPKLSELTGMTSFMPPVYFLSGFFFCDISDCHIRPRAREHLDWMCAPN